MALRAGLTIYKCVCVCVCIYIYIYIYIERERERERERASIIVKIYLFIFVDIYPLKHFMFLFHQNTQNVSQLVRQPAQVDDISEFLWQHLVVDLEVVAKSLGRNKEEATLFMHLLFKRMLSVETPGE